MRRLLLVLAALSALIVGVPPASAQVDTSNDPIGYVDTWYSGGPTTLGSGTVWFATGWVADPDDDKSIPDHQAMVTVTVDGVPVFGAFGRVQRPDVSAVYPFVRQPVGWSLGWTVPDDGRSHEVCVVALNTGPGRDVILRCQTAVPGERDGHEPAGYVDSVTVRAGLVRFTGWAGDPDGTTAPTRVRLVLNGYIFEGWDAASLRPDVDAARPDVPNAGGFDGTIAIPPGQYSWCLSAVNTGPRGLANTDIGCGRIDVPGPTGRVLGSLDAVWYEKFTGVYPFGAAGWAWDPVAHEVPVVRVHTLARNFERPPHDETRDATMGESRPDVPAAIPGVSANAGWRSIENRFGKFGSPVYVCAFAIVDLHEEFIGCRSARDAT
jgi:hypothetical protein